MAGVPCSSITDTTRIFGLVFNAPLFTNTHWSNKGVMRLEKGQVKRMHSAWWYCVLAGYSPDNHTWYATCSDFVFYRYNYYPGHIAIILQGVIWWCKQHDTLQCGATEPGWYLGTIIIIKLMHICQPLITCHQLIIYNTLCCSHVLWPLINGPDFHTINIWILGTYFVYAQIIVD